MPRMHLADEWIQTMLADHPSMGIMCRRNVSASSETFDETFIISLDYALTRCAFRFFYTFFMLSVHFDGWLFMCGLSFIGYETKRVKSSYSSAISITYCHFRRVETYFSNSISQRDESQSTIIKVFLFLLFLGEIAPLFSCTNLLPDWKCSMFVWVVHLRFLSFSVLLRAYLGSMKFGGCLWCGWWGPLWCIMS